LPAGIVWLVSLIWQESDVNEKVLDELPLINARHQRPTAWDFWFRKGVQTHLRIDFADGPSVWGYYGEHSFASYAKDGRDLYLETIYREKLIQANDASGAAPGLWFGEPHPYSHGGWVRFDEAVRIEFYNLGDAATAAKATEDPKGAGTGKAGQPPPSRRPAPPPPPPPPPPKREGT
jgi:hypothetical protein